MVELLGGAGTAGFEGLGEQFVLPGAVGWEGLGGAVLDRLIGRPIGAGRAGRVPSG
ncbi:hypothetical protein [Actinoplanes teichomyceticus]|uniref:hypothetical protein n=1 Tax=Actinoplanes teichomyceticus TaxID=1867 RepID=UPI0013DE3272|nr:hypothetical protein [Actinoplanes teichomyceticus]GIF11528.1 hypothetical protein Ate01nite_15600 [Actinoplanes teichomyceticus]